MVKKKLAHFAENLTFQHLFQDPHPDFSVDFPLKGKWRDDFFQNDHPIVLELGCGKGEYTVNLAMADKAGNFIGADIKGARLWRGCKTAQENGLRNVAFIRTKIEFIEYFFAPDEVDEIWITFPDPFPLPKRSNRRLTSPVFLAKYKKIMKPEGIIHLKTDNAGLYKYTLDVIREGGHTLLFSSDDVYSLETPHPATSIRTFYEAIFQREGIPIKYLEFILSHD